VSPTDLGIGVATGGGPEVVSYPTIRGCEVSRALGKIAVMARTTGQTIKALYVGGALPPMRGGAISTVPVFFEL
jgi:hypothetical protein